MSGAEVSIVIVNFNTFELTKRCIESIYRYTSGISFEIVLVDNASSERSPRDFLLAFPQIILVENPVNEGFSKGNNTGIARCSGGIILLLNSDTELLNNAVAICRESLVTRPDVGVVAARLEYPDGKAQHNCQRFPSLRVSLFELFRLQKIFPRGKGAHTLMGSFFSHDEPAFPDWVWGTFFMFRKRDLERLPGKQLDDSFFMYVEDMQWCRDFRKAGLAVHFEPKARVVHHMGKSGGSKNTLMEKNTRTFMERNYGYLHRRLITLVNHLLA